MPVFGALFLGGYATPGSFLGTLKGMYLWDPPEKILGNTPNPKP